MELRCILNAVFVAYCILLCVVPAKADVSCTAGTFIAGSQGVVRCDFGIDVTKEQHDFNVVRYDFDISLDSRKHLLACNWFEGKMTCPSKAPGYLFDDRVDSTLTLTIPVVDKSMAGSYRCQLVNKPTNDIAMHFCSLTVIDMSSLESTDTLTVNSNSSAESEGAVPATPFIALFIISLIVIVVLVLGIIYISCKYMRKRETTAKIVNRTVDRGTNPVNIYKVVDCIERAVDTEDLAAFASKGNHLVRLFKKEEKKNPPKQSTPKHSEENLEDEKEEEKPLLPATAPLQYFPLISVKGLYAEHYSS